MTILITIYYQKSSRRLIGHFLSSDQPAFEPKTSDSKHQKSSSKIDADILPRCFFFGALVRSLGKNLLPKTFFHQIILEHGNPYFSPGYSGNSLIIEATPTISAFSTDSWEILP